MSIVNELAEREYRVTDDEFAQLVHLSVSADNVSTRIKGDYFNILKTRANDIYFNTHVKTQEDAVEQAHDVFYPMIMAAYTDGIDDAVERNKATNFARSAKSTLLNAVKAGANLGLIGSKAEAQRIIKTSKLNAITTPLDRFKQQVDKLTVQYNDLDDSYKQEARDYILNGPNWSI